MTFKYIKILWFEITPAFKDSMRNTAIFIKIQDAGVLILLFPKTLTNFV